MKTIVLLFFFCAFISTGQTLTGDEEYLPFADTMPEPADGLAKLRQQIKYPMAAKQLKYEGKVIVLAFINETGSVDKVKVIQGVEGGCNEEVERVL